MWAFPVQGAHNQPWESWPTYFLMPLNIKNKNIHVYGLGGGDLNRFQDIFALPVRKESGQTPELIT